MCSLQQEDNSNDDDNDDSHIMCIYLQIWMIPSHDFLVISQEVEPFRALRASDSLGDNDAEEKTLFFLRIPANKTVNVNLWCNTFTSLDHRVASHDLDMSVQGVLAVVFFLLAKNFFSWSFPVTPYDKICVTNSRNN